MVKLESLKKSIQFKKTLKEKKVHSVFFSIFAAKNFYKPKIIDCIIGNNSSMNRFYQPINLPKDAHRGPHRPQNPDPFAD